MASGPVLLDRFELRDAPELVPTENAFMLVEVDRATECFQNLEKMVQDSLPNASLEHAVRIGNGKLWKAYTHVRDAIASNKTNNPDGDPKVRLLFHGTTALSQVLGVFGGSAHGFDPRVSTHGEYGLGSYFAVHAAYPVLIYPRAKVSEGGNAYRLIVAEVALGKTEDCENSVWSEQEKKERSRGRQWLGETDLFDSTRGTEESVGLRHAPNCLAHGEQYVVYKEGQAYPHFVLTIQCPSASPSKPLPWQLDPLKFCEPGNTIALFCVQAGAFLHMKPQAEDFRAGLTHWSNREPAELEQEDRNWEYFKIVRFPKSHCDVALWNPHHKRFLRMVGKRGEKSFQVNAYDHELEDESHLPEAWTLEKWRIVPDNSGRNKVALYNPRHKRFLRIYQEEVGCADEEKEWNQLPSYHDWPSEHFMVVPFERPRPAGS